MRRRIDMYAHLNAEPIQEFPVPGFIPLVELLLLQNYGLQRLLSYLVHHLEGRAEEVLPDEREDYRGLASILREWLERGNF